MFFRILSVVALVVSSSGAAQQAFTIALDGQPVAKIVTAPDIDRPFDDGVRNQAVRDLIRVVAVMSGAALPVVQDTLAFNDGPQIHIGQTEFVKRAGLLPTGLPLSGYRIVTTVERGQPRLVVVGATASGTSNGVYDLLTTELGVMWGIDNELFEEIPKRATVALPAIDRIGRPGMPFSIVTGPSQAWQTRNRLSDRSVEYPYSRHGHNMMNFFRISQYGDHPEYYPLVNGARKIPRRDDDTRVQLCFTNPDVIRITIEKLRAYFDANPQVLGYSLCAADDDEYCTCENCAALDSDAPEFRNREIHTDSYFSYIDTVGKALLKTHPGRYISAYAYDATEPPPRWISHLPSNVVVFLTQDATQHFDDQYRREDERILSSWQGTADHVCLYEYPSLGWILPRNHASLVAERIPYLQRSGIAGYYAEGHPHPAHLGPALYLTAKLAWNPALNADTTMDDWYRVMFRESAPQMKRFYVTLDSAWTHADRQGFWFAGSNRMWEEFAAYPPLYREVAWHHLEAALRAASDDVTRRRVEYIRDGHEPAYRVARAFEWAHALTEESSEEDVLRVLTEFDAFMASYFANIESNPAYADVYYRGYRFHERTKWIKLDILRCIDRALANRPDIRQRLLASNATFSEMNDTSQNRRTKGYRLWTNRDMELRGVYPDYISDQPPYLPME
jgi:hypothetical protein